MNEQQKVSISVGEPAIQEFASRLCGTLLRPSDAGYEQACRVYNGMIEKRPALALAARTGSGRDEVLA
ncbi:MAG: hypothetical protein ACJ8CB_09075 [Ktedonobacteraceae bacterium]